MCAAVEQARAGGNSLGGVIECAAVGLPAGLGDPMMDGLESRISALAFAVPAVKGVEFGSGFAGSALWGSQNNDAFYVQDGQSVRAPIITAESWAVFPRNAPGVPRGGQTDAVDRARAGKRGFTVHAKRKTVRQREA